MYYLCGLFYIKSIIETYFRYMNLFRRFFFTAAMSVLTVGMAMADIPDGYYDSCEGKTGQDLLQALYQKIYSHTNVGYDGLWNVYKKSDVRANGTLWDIYTTKEWSSNFTKCGNYKSIGDCVNREHSMPKSVWGGGKSAQYSDAFHLYPTDGKVNGQRSNYPYGECANGTRLADNGSVKALGKLGTCTFSGYSGKVFEPDDEYKGDLARSYFYMAACYNNLISSWTQGEMGNMMGGNNYPVFKTWAVNLLLKWARQDEVSQKELDRNEAIYSFQKNRNPFIDHPELVEYIWGDKVGQAWYPGAASDEADILQPVQKVTIDMGIAAINLDKTYDVVIKTKNVEGNVNLSIYDQNNALSINTGSITAAQANAGYTLTITCNSSIAETVQGTLSISADDMEREVDVTCNVVDGLPVYDATNISSDEFTVRWVNIGVATTYSLDVKLGSLSITGYPRTVTASDETYTVTGLEPLTTYTYQLSSSTISSEIKTVTTADLVPSIDILFDGTLTFETTPGTPSDIAELLVEIDNISDDVTITVVSPFEISTDKSTWATSITLEPEQDRFYMRVNSSAEGNFDTDITAQAGDYIADDFTATATVSSSLDEPLKEDWEQVNTTNVTCYSNTTFQGSACEWAVSDGGFGGDTSFNGTVVMRMGKNTNSTLSMNEDKSGGLGTVAFDAAKWNNDADAVVNVEYSLDNGTSWILAKQFTFETNTSSSYSVEINKTGSGRVRFRQSSGKRWFIDNLSISSYNELQGINEFEYHSWDAYCRDGKLIVDCRDGAAPVSIYGVDGITWIVNEQLSPGEHSFDLPKGLYIVVSNDFSRRVLVK